MIITGLGFSFTSLKNLFKSIHVSYLFGSKSLPHLWNVDFSYHLLFDHQNLFFFFVNLFSPNLKLSTEQGGGTLKQTKQKQNRMVNNILNTSTEYFIWNVRIQQRNNFLKLLLFFVVMFCRISLCLELHQRCYYFRKSYDLNSFAMSYL